MNKTGDAIVVLTFGLCIIFVFIVVVFLHEDSKAQAPSSVQDSQNAPSIDTQTVYPSSGKE